MSRTNLVHLAGRTGLIGDEPMLRQVVAENVADPRVVVHDQDSGGAAFQHQ
jgi:hypothetical protein